MESGIRNPESETETESRTERKQNQILKNSVHIA